MIHITLKDGTVREIESGTTAAELAKSISGGLYRSACAAKIDGEIRDLRTPLTEDAGVEILTFADEAGAKAFRHTAGHILAQAVLRLYPGAKLATGPATATGFFYDFDVPRAFDAEDLARIEAEMRAIVKEDLPVERFELSPAEALELMKEQPYKCELIEEHAGKGDRLSFYRQGDFTDLCAGPHLMRTGQIGAFKLTQCTGAYWRGDAAKAQLCRVYGTAFPKTAELESYLAAVEEAKKRDHNIIGRQLGYFTTSDLVGQGLPLLGPKGAKVLQILQRFVEDEEERRGYLLTKTPFMAKREMYQLSGHWEHYHDGMFILGDESDEKAEIFALRPMTCPFQFTVYNSEMHSYRDLPIRYNETSTLFRNEASGEMHGLIRVRQFTLSEGHLVVRPDQLTDEFKGVIDLVKFMMNALGIQNDVTYRFSKRDPKDAAKYIGDDALWRETEGRMEAILNEIDIPYTAAEGEAAFYGPKLDIQARNVHGKEDTLITVQIDFSLAERFGMVYVDQDGVKKPPYIIHRSSIGCYERTLAMLLEKYAGALPLWLAPEQARVLPISERQIDAARALTEKLRAAGLRAHFDEQNEKIGYKIRQAQLEKVPYMLVLGDKEIESGEVSVRARARGDLGAMTPDAFLAMALEEARARAIL